MNKLICIYIYIQVCIYIYIYICVYTHTYSPPPCLAPPPCPGGTLRPNTRKSKRVYSLAWFSFEGVHRYFRHTVRFASMCTWWHRRRSRDPESGVSGGSARSARVYIYIYIYIYDSRSLAYFRCRFIEGVVSRATFLNGFLLFGVWFWRWGWFRSLGRLWGALRPPSSYI